MQKLVTYLSRDRLELFGSNLKAPVSLPFTQALRVGGQAMVKDMEVVDEGVFRQQLHDILQSNKVAPSQVLLVIAAEMYFTKEVPPSSPTETTDAFINTFLTHVPFADPAHRIYHAGKQEILVVINQAFVEIIDIVFKEQNSSVVGAVPIVALQTIMRLDAGFTEQAAQHVMQKFETIRDLSVQRQQEEPSESDPITTPTKNNNRLIILLGVLGMGVVILVFLFITNNPFQTPKPVAPITPTPLVTVAQPPPSTPQPEITSPLQKSTPASQRGEPAPQENQIAKKDLTVEVLNGSGIPGQADAIRASLLDLGFKTVQTGNAPSVILSKTLVIFAPHVPTQVRLEVTETLKKELNTDLTIQENASAPVDISVTTARPTPTPTL